MLLLSSQATSSKTLTFEGWHARSVKTKIPRTEVPRRRSGRPRQTVLPHRRGLAPVQTSCLRAALLGDGILSAQADQGKHRTAHVPPPRGGMRAANQASSLSGRIHHCWCPPAPEGGVEKREVTIRPTFCQNGEQSRAWPERSPQRA